MSRRFVKTQRSAGFGTQGRAARAQAQARVSRASARFRSATAAPARRRAAMGVETKFFDTAVAAVTVAATAALTGGEYDPTALPAACLCLSSPGQGDDAQSRDGRKISIKNVQVKGTILRGASEDAVNPPQGEKVFVALVLDTQTNGAQLNSEDVYKNLAADASGTVAPLRNLLTGGDRFRILKSEMFDMDCPSVSVEADNLHSTAGVSATFDWFLEMKDLPVHFNSTTNVVGNVVDNSIHVVAFSIAGLCTLAYNARIRFVG